MDRKYRLLTYTFNYHLDLSCAPNIVCVPHINLLSNFNFVHSLFQLPSLKFTFLCFPLNFHISIIRISNKLWNHIINGKTRQQNWAFGSPYGLLADEALFLDDQILIDAFGAEAMATYSGLAFIYEIETQWANQTLEILVWINLLVYIDVFDRAAARCLLISVCLLRLLFQIVVLSYLLWLLDQLLLFHELVEKFKLFISFNYGLAAVFVRCWIQIIGFWAIQGGLLVSRFFCSHLLVLLSLILNRRPLEFWGFNRLIS